jgi:hypothetical protein
MRGEIEKEKFSVVFQSVLGVATQEDSGLHKKWITVV